MMSRTHRLVIHAESTKPTTAPPTTTSPPMSPPVRKVAMKVSQVMRSRYRSLRVLLYPRFEAHSSPGR